MDILQSLNLDDQLPEQQTRIIHLTADETTEFELRLGFDACCTCGKAEPMIECENCHRVSYCSVECRNIDSEANLDDDHALGHSAVICTLLAACNDDEAVEDGKGHLLDSSQRRTAAVDRVTSEFESYPATLANVIMDGPCFQDTLNKVAKGSLTIHIIGASVDSELWVGHPDSSQTSRVFHCYAEALADIADRFKLQAIHLYFIGPDCPEIDGEAKVKIPSIQSSKSECILSTTTIRNDYNKKTLRNNKVTNADIVVFFNPGFTCPDYSWDEGLHTIPQGTPCLVTTNTELEGVNDIEYLLKADIISGIPAGLAMMLNEETPEAVFTDDTFFSLNPHTGSRVRQSGTMANDLYVKNRWIFGGMLGNPPSDTCLKVPAKKQRIEGSGNSKRSNPALV